MLYSCLFELGMLEKCQRILHLSSLNSFFFANRQVKVKVTFPDDLINERENIIYHEKFSHFFSRKKLLKAETTIQNYHGAGVALEKHLLRDIAGFNEGTSDQNKRKASSFKMQPV